MSSKKPPETTSEPSKPTVSPTVLTPDMLQAILGFLGESDLALAFDLRVLGAEGEIFQVKGTSSFPQAMRPENKGVIPGQFENVVVNGLLNPLLQRFNDHIQNNVENILPVPAVNPMLLDDSMGPSNPLDAAILEEEDVTEDPQPDQGTIP